MVEAISNDSSDSPEVSIIIPAYNEAEFIERTIAEIKNSMVKLSVPWELIVVDNNSSDDTGKLAQACGAKVVFEPYNQISKARNAGGNAAIAKYLIFIDADTIVSGQAMEAAIANLNAEMVGGGAQVAFDEKAPGLGAVVLAIWNWASRTNKWAAGSFVYCLKEGFDAVGGFPEYVYASEEIFFSRKLKKWGRKRSLGFKVLPLGGIVTSSRKLQSQSIVACVFQILVMMIFPWVVFSRRLCWLWYRR